MAQNPGPDDSNRNGRSDISSNGGSSASDAEYKVGPGRPPKEHQFKPGQSGNPKGAKRKAPSIVPDIKALLEQALKKPVTLRQGEHKKIVTMAAAGIEQLVAQFVKGDRYARRDVIFLADKFGIDLAAAQTKEVLAANHEAILSAYVQKQYDVVVRRPPVFAPPELLDDDSEDQNGK